MELHGKNYGFAYTVGAEAELAKLCPGEDLRQLSAVLKGRDEKALETNKELLCILSRWDEKIRRLDDPSYVEKPLTKDLIDALPVREFLALQAEAFAAIRRDNTPTVEAEAGKKGEAPA